MNQDSSRERVSGGGFARGWQRTHLVRQVLNWLRDSSAGWSDLSRFARRCRREVWHGNATSAIRSRAWDTHWSIATIRRSNRSATSFFKIRRALGTTAFGINEVRLPAGPRGHRARRGRDRPRGGLHRARRERHVHRRRRSCRSRSPATTSASTPVDAAANAGADGLTSSSSRASRSPSTTAVRPCDGSIVGTSPRSGRCAAGLRGRRARVLRWAARAARSSRSRRCSRFEVGAGFGSERASCTSASRPVLAGRQGASCLPRRLRRRARWARGVARRLRASTCAWADDAEIPGQRRFHVSDPWGNRLEIVAAARELRYGHSPIADGRDVDRPSPRTGALLARTPAPARCVTFERVPCLQGISVPPLGRGWRCGVAPGRSRLARGAAGDSQRRRACTLSVASRDGDSRADRRLRARRRLRGGAARGRRRPDRRGRRAGPRAIPRRADAARGGRGSGRDARRRRARERDRAGLRGSAGARADRRRDERRRRQRRRAPRAPPRMRSVSRCASGSTRPARAPSAPAARPTP